MMPTMDTRFVLQGITFIWDENKARENPLRHDGVTFEQAAEAFFDPFLKVVDAQITFNSDESGKGTGATLHQNGQDQPAKRIE